MKLSEPRAARKRGSMGWRRQIAYAAKEAYGSQPPPTAVKKRVQMGSKDAAASQDRDRGVVAEARPQGTASTSRSPVARRQ